MTIALLPSPLAEVARDASTKLALRHRVSGERSFVVLALERDGHVERSVALRVDELIDLSVALQVAFARLKKAGAA